MRRIGYHKRARPCCLKVYRLAEHIYADVSLVHRHKKGKKRWSESHALHNNIMPERSLEHRFGHSVLSSWSLERWHLDKMGRRKVEDGPNHCVLRVAKEGCGCDLACPYARRACSYPHRCTPWVVIPWRMSDSHKMDSYFLSFPMLT